MDTVGVVIPPQRAESYSYLVIARAKCLRRYKSETYGLCTRIMNRELQDSHISIPGYMR
jgi:hypothetical protein